MKYTAVQPHTAYTHSTLQRVFCLGNKRWVSGTNGKKDTKKNGTNIIAKTGGPVDVNVVVHCPSRFVRLWLVSHTPFAGGCGFCLCDVKPP